MEKASKVLFVAANPIRMKLDFAQELDRIERAGRGSGGYKVMARWAVGLRELGRLASSSTPDVVHILSPGVEQDSHLMYLGDDQGTPERVSPDALAKVFRLQKAPPKLVVLNTCHSAPHGEAIAPFVGSVIAMRGLVMDAAAIEFSDGLYRALAAGSTVEAAFQSARKAMLRQYPLDTGDPILVRGRSDPAKLVLPVPASVRTGTAAKLARRRPAKMDVSAIRIFCSYSHKDAKYRDQLETFLSSLRMEKLIHVWHDRLIKPGTDWARDISSNLEHAQIVLLLVSADFIASQYCMGIELKKALQRQKKHDLRVIPILIRECDLKGTPLTKLQWLPTGSKPVKKWSDRDSAWTDVAKGIRKTVEELVGVRA